MKKAAPLILVALLMGIFSAGLSAADSAQIDLTSLRVMPNCVEIREYFRGADVAVFAEIPKGTEAVVELKGDSHEDHLLRKGRRGGLWMSVGEVTVEGAPSVYLVMTTPDTEKSGAQIAKQPYARLEKLVEFKGSLPKAGAVGLFDQLVKLKESEGLYGVFPNTLKVRDSQGDHTDLEGHLRLPGNIAPGNYQVLLSVLKDGKLLEIRSTELRIEMKGMPALLLNLAHQHAVFYGVFSVLIAVIAGISTAVMFGNKGAH